MNDPLALTVSVLALAVSTVTAWLTLFRRGTVQMTQPTVIFFGPDMPRSRQRNPKSKIYLRTLLFATSKRGRIIESMHVALTRSETHQNFNIWVHGETGKLVRGSGLFVGDTGVSANHHFLAPEDVHFQWLAGHYHLSVHAKLLGDKAPKVLFTQVLEITRDLAVQLEQPGAGLYFDWGPDSARYLPHIDERPPSPDPEQFFEALGLTERSSGAPSAPVEQ